MEPVRTIDEINNEQKLSLLKNFKRYCNGEINMTQLGEIAHLSKVEAHFVMGSINNLPDGNPYVR